MTQDHVTYLHILSHARQVNIYYRQKTTDSLLEEADLNDFEELSWKTTRV